MTSKNQLQEYCQKRKIILPTYFSVMTGISHQPNWSAHVVVNNQTFNSPRQDYKTKTEAEMAAAQQALSIVVESQSVDNKINDLTMIKKVMFIDLENVAAFNMNIQNDTLYIGVASESFHSLSKYNNWTRSDSLHVSSVSRCNLFTIQNAGVKDTSDHLLTLLCYTLVNEILPCITSIQEISIVSNDHAKFCTKQCLEWLLEKYPSYLPIKVSTV